MSLKTASPDAFDFQPGTGFDFAYSSRDKITFAASGLETVIRVSTRGDLFTLISQIGEQETELTAGTYKEVGEHLELIRKRVFPPRPRGIVLSKLTLSVSFIALAAVLFCTVVTERQAFLANIAQRTAASQQVSPEELQNLREYLMQSPVGAGKLPNLNTVPRAKATDGAPVADGANMLGVPSYQQKLYEDAPAKPEATQPIVPPAPADSTPVTVPAVKVDPKPPADVKAEVTTPNPTAAQDEAEVSALKEKVTERLKGSNLSKAQAEKALNEISMLTPQQLTGASLDSLPPEVRQMLLDQVQADADASDELGTAPKDNVQDGVPTKLIMLPEQVIDGYRGHDGIASLPENSSWQARGNPAVHIPLPGGGDIKSVEDLKAFGVQP
jgi:hypothetical protein